MKRLLSGAVSVVLLLAGTLLALSPGTVAAQSQGGPWKVGVLWDAKTLPPRILPLADWLREDLMGLGFAEKEIDLVVRQAEEPSGLREAARDLIKDKVNAIWASTPPAALAAKAETRDVPIVFGMAAGDPVQLGLVEGLARPGGNVTGIAFREWHLSAKRLEILKEMVPRLRRVLVPVDLAYPGTPSTLEELRGAARKLGITLVEQPLTSRDDIERLASVLKRERVDGVLPILNSATNQHFELVVKALNEARVPDIHFYLPAVEQGLVMAAYAPNHREALRASARLLAKILRGTRTQDLPVESPDVIELRINLKVAKERGVQIPQVLLLRAHKVFQ